MILTSPPFELRDPASEFAVADLQTAIGLALPDSLIALLKESNGAFNPDGCALYDVDSIASFYRDEDVSCYLGPFVPVAADGTGLRYYIRAGTAEREIYVAPVAAVSAAQLVRCFQDIAIWASNGCPAYKWPDTGPSEVFVKISVLPGIQIADLAAVRKHFGLEKSVALLAKHLATAPLVVTNCLRKDVAEVRLSNISAAASRYIVVTEVVSI